MQRLAMGQSFNKVKTLPMFNIIPEFWIRKPCLFLNKKLYSPQSLFNLNLKGTLSGIYTLIGFEHVITGSDCYSSFTTFRKSFLTEELEESPKAPIDGQGSLIENMNGLGPQQDPYWNGLGGGAM